MINLEIDDEHINKILDSKIKEILKSYKRTLVTVDMKDLVKMTGLSESTLSNKIVCEPEIVAVTRRIGKRVLYKYPEIKNALSVVIDRLGSYGEKA